MPRIPKHAKKVFKGIIFDVYHWRQKMFDGSYETFEAVRRESTVLVIAELNNKIVIIEQLQPGSKWFFSLPAGRMDAKGETPKQTAKRELLEEAGLRPKKLFLWKLTEDPSRKIEHKIYIFIAQNCVKVAEQKLDAGEKIKVLLYSFERFLKLAGEGKFIEGEIKKLLKQARDDAKFRAKFKKVIFG